MPPARHLPPLPESNFSMSLVSGRKQAAVANLDYFLTHHLVLNNMVFISFSVDDPTVCLSLLRQDDASFYR